MLAVGIKELKAKLSQFVRLAQAGEVVLVTDHNQIVAELRPARKLSQPVDSLEEILEELASEGELVRSSRAKKDRFGKLNGLGLPEGTATQILDELRAEH